MAFLEPKNFKTRSGQAFTIRTAQPEDAAALLAYILPIAEETEFFIIEPDEFPASEEQEQKWIREHLDSPGKILLLAETSGGIIGNLNFENGPYRRIAHRGTLGITVVKPWRRHGVGTALLQTLLQWAAVNALVEKVCLEVFTTNETAIGLYKKLGFREEGLRLKDVKVGPGKYVDALLMSKFVRFSASQVRPCQYR